MKKNLIIHLFYMNNQEYIKFSDLSDRIEFIKNASAEQLDIVLFYISSLNPIELKEILYNKNLKNAHLNIILEAQAEGSFDILEEMLLNDYFQQDREKLRIISNHKYFEKDALKKILEYNEVSIDEKIEIIDSKIESYNA